MPFKRIDGDDTTDDTAGNMSRGKGVEDGVETDDTEGHGLASKHIADGVEDDDTEGNTVRSGRSIPPTANPGKVVRPRG